MICCNKCDLSKTRYNIVQFNGNRNAKILFILDLPSINEDILGKAGVDTSGKLLYEMIEESGINLMSTGFLNCLLCRPCDKRGGLKREPTLSEMAICANNNINEIIDRINPLIKVTVGDYAKRFYHSKYHLIDTGIVQLTGGKNSPFYRDCILKLERIENEI